MARSAHREAVGYFEQALAALAHLPDSRAATALGHGGLQAWAHLSLGQIYYDIGDYPRAVESLQRNVATHQGELHYERFGAIGSVSATSRAWLSYCHAECGAFTEGLAIAEEGLRIEAYLLAGRLEAARQRAAQAIDLARQHQQRGIQAWALWLLGESLARQATPEVESATGHYCQALALAEELGQRPLQAHCHHGLGTLYVRQGQRQQARTALSAAIDLYRAMDMIFGLAEAEAALAKVA